MAKIKLKLNMGVLVEEVTDPAKFDKMEQEGIETEVFEDMPKGQAEFVDQLGRIVAVYEVDEKGVYKRVK